MINIPQVHGSVTHRDGMELVVPQLIVKPEIVMLQIGATLQLVPYLRTEAGEVKLTTNVSYSSTNTASATVGSTGLVTAVAAGTATIGVTWQDTLCMCGVTVLDSDCSATQVAYEVLIDNSRSMSAQFNNQYASKFEAARQLAIQFIAGINATKDTIGLMTFSTYADELVPIGSDSVYGSLYGMELSQAFTTFLPSIQSALANLSEQSAQKNVMVIISDGRNLPKMRSGDVSLLLSRVTAFKKLGGVVIVCGMLAEGKAFDLLQNLASQGFFINIYGDGASVISTAATTLKSLLGFFCGGNVATTPTAQLPCPNPSPQNFEDSVVPKFASTKTVTVGAQTASATAFSDLSQNDADSKANAKAFAIVNKALYP